MKKVQEIKTETITKLAQKDYDAYANKQKSYKLLNWIKDEMILCQVFNKTTLQIEPKALARIINILALIRERNLTKCDITILDGTSAQIDFKFDLTTLTNAERIRLNTTYEGVDLELVDEPEDDEIYDHMV